MTSLDIYGHFGTTYSYATVGAHVARALRDEGRLGYVYNLDASWHDSLIDLRDRVPSSPSSHVLVFAPPNHYIDVIASGYRPKHAALFVSPNTDTFIDEHVETATKFGLLVAPSVWCKSVVERAMIEQPLARVPRVVLLPLGVSPLYAKGREERPLTDEPRILHLTSDQVLPGRKGTEALVRAWEIAKKRFRIGGDLVIHMPRSLEISLRYMIEDCGVGDSIELIIAPLRGATDAELAAEYKRADLVVLPSRAEGFGMMMLAALVARVPLLTTYATGQADFLAGMGGWMSVPYGYTAPLEYEEGNAPVIDHESLAVALALAADVGTRRAMKASAALTAPPQDWGTWQWSLPMWVGALKEWMEATA